MRPTGQLHLGHYLGALENWIQMQHEYECFFLIADYQAMGDHLDDIGLIQRSVIEVATDWLGGGPGSREVGLRDPELRAGTRRVNHVLFHAHAVEPAPAKPDPSRRNPAQLEAESQSITLGFFNYPISQAADILLPKAHLVPVGEDQVAHIEYTRDVARRFNRLYGEVFPVPRAQGGPRSPSGRAPMARRR